MASRVNSASANRRRAALSYLRHGHTASTWRIAQATELTAPKARRTMHSLADLGYVQPVRAERSGRVYWWHITSAGLDFLKLAAAADGTH